jgi:SAM-dependent methyltransferase
MGDDWLVWLASLPVGQRDEAFEERLGIAGPVSSRPPGADMIGHHTSGVAPIVRALIEAPVRRDDVFVDLGCGLGKVVVLAALITGARSRGIELQPTLVERARRAASAASVDVELTLGDARDAELGDGTVFYLYAPFTGAVLDSVLERLRAVASRRAIVVCALGLELDRASWLKRRDLDSFWLSIYDSVLPGATPRQRREATFSKHAEAIAHERCGRHLPGV